MLNHHSKWCCRGCGQLLGVVDGDRLEIHTARGHQYRVAFPVTCVCKNPKCKALNELRRVSGVEKSPPAALSQARV